MILTPASALPPQLFLLDPTVTFLNHGSFGATPRPVFEDYQAWQLELERQPVEFMLRRFPELMRTARSALADLIGVAADDLVLVPNATMALNIVARSLRLQPDDEILTTDQEYGAMDRMWGVLCRESGAIYRPVPVAPPFTTGAAFADAIWAGVTPRTRVLFLSHLTSPTALILPVADLCRRARAAGILSIVDGAHTLGQVPLDVGAIGADFYTSNAHKWLCAPKGSAFLHARPEVQKLVAPLVISWGDGLPGATGRPFLDDQQWTGTRDVAAFLAVPAAIRFWAEHDGERARAQCRELARHARAELLAQLRTEPLSSDSAEWFAQLFAVPLPPGCDGRQLQAELYARHRVEVPVTRWRDRPLLRVSIQVYNSAADVARLQEALADCLPRCREKGEGK
jgi:isopenicillin-N epimerase